ncbi:hypothetical protein [Pseudophaeobacter leonis]|uniref:hypothetical protein n=1 Tax=Pseudophaeobacter leonis TaxID=1144477 RepID=UPI001374834C|nr:hypothetical protein [Pseudophaeobacter leonis]
MARLHLSFHYHFFSSPFSTAFFGRKKTSKNFLRNSVFFRRKISGRNSLARGQSIQRFPHPRHGTTADRILALEPRADLFNHRLAFSKPTTVRNVPDENLEYTGEPIARPIVQLGYRVLAPAVKDF